MLIFLQRDWGIEAKQATLIYLIVGSSLLEDLSSKISNSRGKYIFLAINSHKLEYSIIIPINQLYFPYYFLDFPELINNINSIFLWYGLLCACCYYKSPAKLLITGSWVI